MKMLITGTRCGIGNFMARRFAAAGHEVWGLSRHAQTEFERECAQRGYAFRWSPCDISDWAQVSAFRQEVGSVWPHVDALICCAGIQGPIAPTMTLDPAAWSASLRINLDGTFFTVRAFYDLLLRRSIPRAKVLCFSGGGSASPRPNFSPYACAKAAVVRLVENLAREWADLPIDINAIAPGAINTRMTDEVIGLGPALAGAKEYAAATAQKAGGGAPLARVAELFELLLSPAGAGISGKLISVPWDPWFVFPQHRQDIMGSDLFTLRRIALSDRGQDWSTTGDPASSRTP